MKFPKKYAIVFQVLLLGVVLILPTGVLGARTYYPQFGYSTPTYPGSPTNPPIANALNVSCTATPLAPRIGETVLWYSSVTGGIGNYQYFWSGTDGLTGNTSSVQRAYATPGTKSATVTVISGSQTITVGCTNVITVGGQVTTPPPTFLGISCYATNERIAPGESTTWIAVTSGSFASTTIYKWEGTDGLTGSEKTVTKTYPLAGTKQAILSVISGESHLVAACTNKVTVAPKTAPTPPKKEPVTPPVTVVVPREAPLQGICAPSLAQAKIKESITWQATAIGGNGTYQFSWSGDELLQGQGTTTSKFYENPGRKSATVLIGSGQKSIAVKCAPGLEIIEEEKETGLLAASIFGGMVTPLFILLAIIFALLFGACVARARRRTEEEKESELPKPPLPPQPTFEPATHEKH